MTGLLGVLQTGLIVTSITRILSLNKEETKILRFVDRHNVNRVFANAAARLIQARWRLYKRKRICIVTSKTGSLNILTQRYNNAWRHWRKVKEQKRFQDGVFMTGFFFGMINFESFLDFLTDTPEVVRESILCELENISDFFGKFLYQ